jgi:hypothetical protein
LMWIKTLYGQKLPKKVKLMVTMNIKQYHDLTSITQPRPTAEYHTQFEKMLKGELVY